MRTEKTEFAVFIYLEGEEWHHDIFEPIYESEEALVEEWVLYAHVHPEEIVMVVQRKVVTEEWDNAYEEAIK